MRDFEEQAFYNKRTREEYGDALIGEYLKDFWDWYSDNLETAPAVDGDSLMTCLSSFGSRKTKNIARRGIAGYYRARGKFPDFQKPRNFTEMTLLNSIVAPLPTVIPADKLNVGNFIPQHRRDFVRPAKVFRSFSSAEELNFDGLAPGSYYLKANHGSAQAERITLPMAPAELESLREKTEFWLSKPYGLKSSQWWYRLIERKVFVEEDLCRVAGEPIPDFRFHCINGQVALLQLDLGLGSDERNNPIFDGDLNYMPHDFLRDNLGEVDLPKNAELARDVAKEIAAPFPYVRVDIYVRDSEMILGELTFLPNSGRRKILSDEINDHLCSFWKPMPQVVGIAA